MAELRVKGTGTLKLFESDNTSSVTIASPASLSANKTITLPDADVTLASGTMLATDGSGASLTSLNASELGSGTVPTARLGTGTASSSTVLYGDQTYKAEPGGNNTPAFQVYLTGDQTIANDTLTKVAMTGEIVDTDSAYDNSSNYRFTVPAGEGGKYFFFWRIFCHVNGSPVTGANVPLYKNGSAYTGTASNWGMRIDDSNGFDYLALSGSYIVDLDATDYVELYAKALTVDSSSSVLLTANALGFGGYKLIGA